MKFGIIFYAILGSLALFIGIYLLQYFIPLSIIFFIASFINGVFIYKEYSFHKSDKIEYDENSVPDEIIIKYSRSGRIIAIATYGIFVILGLFFLLGFKFKFNGAAIFILCILLGFTGYFMFKIISEIKKISQIIISINGKGIQVKNNTRYLWSEIQLEKIIVKRLVSRESKHDYKPEINYLYFFHNNEKIEINIDDFDITDGQLAQVLKIFRGRFNNSSIV
ncbi:hypothetical protein MTQ00_02065 [Chryseobacterium sp. B21-037]|uniref:hypothetical protein n=1 Tax=unclassified Chryseobacterium TaxID=2593645 RepID=UPI002358B060|nr:MULTISPECIES: hypothetical protein [unclassified Chryseobacterium]MDC8103314.1 hypothetical protein [Chryseobacterium sp. B21-037]MDQ1802867.1 hypothetical protein [Chryseobacterium sp. CKR4-1]